MQYIDSGEVEVADATDFVPILRISLTGDGYLIVDGLVGGGGDLGDLKIQRRANSKIDYQDWLTDFSQASTEMPYASSDTLDLTPADAAFQLKINPGRCHLRFMAKKASANTTLRICISSPDSGAGQVDVWKLE